MKEINFLVYYQSEGKRNKKMHGTIGADIYSYPSETERGKREQLVCFVYLRNSCLCGARFVRCVMNGLNFSKADITGCTFEKWYSYFSRYIWNG